MRIVLQRVKFARVISDNRIISEIGRGLLIFLGVGRGDKKEDCDGLTEKIAKMRIFENFAGKFDLSLMDVKGDVMIVSEFTLYADTKKGNRPDFFRAEDREKAQEIYNYFIDSMKRFVGNVQSGEFGNFMEIELTNDGPVTILMER